MSERISLVATTDGPLWFYAAPGLGSHGDAREGWNIKGGAELEWTGEHHNSLTVRHEDADVASTIRAMVMAKYPDRTSFLGDVFEASVGRDLYLRGYARDLPETPVVKGEIIR